MAVPEIDRTFRLFLLVDLSKKNDEGDATSDRAAAPKLPTIARLWIQVR
jgi:hypothetical protein